MEERRKKKYKFLVIDDDSDTLSLYKIVAKNYDINLETTTEASKFIELFNEGEELLKIFSKSRKTMNASK